MESHNERADELLRDADRIEEPSKDLESDIESTREDWDAKKKTEAVPGAIEIAEDKPAEPEPNEFEFEERKPDTADASGPSALSDESDDSDDDSDDDS
jgi:hypothetical protein